MDALAAGDPAVELTPREEALCSFAEKLSREVAGMKAEDLKPLRQVGLTDAGILDAVQVISYFNYINRVAEALGVPPESDWEENDVV